MPNERRVSKWSQKEIKKLIQLYAKEECLWNPYNENYKNKVTRNKAMEKICKEINIEPQMFLKKVHNLRNQFNSEYKKLERSIEEVEMLGGKANVPLPTSKWIHFDSLMFLKDVIVRMPAAPPAKRIIMESNIADGEYTDYNDIVELDDDYDDPKIEEEFQNLTSNDGTGSVTPSKRLANMPTSSLQLKKVSQDFNKTVQQSTTPALIELATMNSVVSLGPEKNLQSPSAQQFDVNSQDQWSAFGAFVANEMRNYQSDASRRKLKRKIMQAMLEVAEEDELLN